MIKHPSQDHIPRAPQGAGAPEQQAVCAADQIIRNHAHMGAIDTADDFEAAFIFAAAELVRTDTDIARRIGELMSRPENREALWRA